jgi:hypothetical protein
VSLPPNYPAPSATISSRLQAWTPDHMLSSTVQAKGNCARSRGRANPPSSPPTPAVCLQWVSHQNNKQTNKPLQRPAQDQWAIHKHQVFSFSSLSCYCQLVDDSFGLKRLSLNQRYKFAPTQNSKQPLEGKQKPFQAVFCPFTGCCCLVDSGRGVKYRLWSTVPIKSLDTPNYSRFFLYFYYFLHCRIIVKTSNLWNNIM